MYSVFELRLPVLTGLLFATCVSAGDATILIGIDPATRVTGVARYRFTNYLQAHGCEADIRFITGGPGLALAFLPGLPRESAPILVAVNRDGQLPVPVWVTRRTAGVSHIRELQGRDLATVAGKDPLGASLPLGALQQWGVTPESGQLYGAGDYSSALGLLLHNNTHGAVSELGFVRPFLTGNDLVVSWQGEPVTAAGWYRRAGWSHGAEACERALAGMRRSDDPQIFAIFPEWVNGFAVPDSPYTEDSSR